MALSLIYSMAGQIAKEILGAPEGRRRRVKLRDFEGKGFEENSKGTSYFVFLTNGYKSV